LQLKCKLFHGEIIGKKKNYNEVCKETNRELTNI